LQRNFDNVCFADLSEHDMDLLSEPANTIQLFRLTQLIMEYQLHVQNHLLDTIQRQKDWIDSHSNRNAKLRKELEELRRKQSIAPQQTFRCSECNATFSGPEYLERHIERRHRGQPTPVAAAPVDLGPLQKELEAIRGAITASSAENLQRMAGLEVNLEGVAGDSVAQIKQHVTEEADRIIRELSGLQYVPPPVPPPRAVTPEPVPQKQLPVPVVHPLERPPKYVWFKNMPYLLARYPAPRPATLIKTLKTLQQVAQGHTSDSLAAMSRESQSMGHPRAAVAGAAETIVRKHFTPNPKVTLALEQAEAEFHTAQLQRIDARSKIVEDDRDREMERTRKVDAEVQSIHAQMVAAGRTGVPPPQRITPTAGGPPSLPQRAASAAPGLISSPSGSSGLGASAMAAGSPNNHGFVSSPSKSVHMMPGIPPRPLTAAESGGSDSDGNAPPPGVLFGGGGSGQFRSAATQQGIHASAPASSSLATPVAGPANPNAAKPPIPPGPGPGPSLSPSGFYSASSFSQQAAGAHPLSPSPSPAAQPGGLQASAMPGFSPMAPPVA
jgi:hypothetical protein